MFDVRRRCQALGEAVCHLFRCADEVDIYHTADHRSAPQCSYCNVFSAFIFPATFHDGDGGLVVFPHPPPYVGEVRVDQGKVLSKGQYLSAHVAQCPQFRFC